MAENSFEDAAGTAPGRGRAGKEARGPGRERQSAGCTTPCGGSPADAKAEAPGIAHVLQEPFEPKLLFLPAGTRAFRFRGAKPRSPRAARTPLEWTADGSVSYREAGEKGVFFEALVGRWPDGIHTPEPGRAVGGHRPFRRGIRRRRGRLESWGDDLVRLEARLSRRARCGGVRVSCPRHTAPSAFTVDPPPSAAHAATRSRTTGRWERPVG